MNNMLKGIDNGCVYLDDILISGAAAQIRNHTRRDPTLAKVLQHVQSVKPYANRKLELSVDSGCVLWGARVIIPTSLRSVVLNELHEVHTRVVRMKSRSLVLGLELISGTVTEQTPSVGPHYMHFGSDIIWSGAFPINISICYHFP